MPRPVVRVCHTKSSSFFNRDGVVNSPVNGAIYTRENTNLFLNGNSFSNASWTKNRCTVASGATGPTGLTDAWTLSEDGTLANIHLLQPASFPVIIGKRMTISVDVKASNRTWVFLQLGNGTNGLAYFNLSTGNFGTTAGTVRKISYGSGWYRIFVTCPSVSTNNNALIVIGEADNDVTFDGLSQASILIRNAQLTEGDPDEYLSSGSVLAREKY